MPDRSFAHRCYANWLAPAQVEQTLSRLALAAESLRQQQLDPLRVCWVFQNLRIHLAPRPDGHWLALFVENRPDLNDGAPQTVLTEFANLPAV